MLLHAVVQRASSPAITFRERTYSYAEFGRCVAGLTWVLAQRGVARERVAIILPNGPEFTFAAFASMAAGAQAAMLNPRLTPAELQPVIEDVDPAAIITTPVLQDSIREYMPGDCFIDLQRDLCWEEWCCNRSLHLCVDQVPRDSPAYLLYTGGTTGRPKGVNHTHSDLMLTIEGMDYCWPTLPNEEVWLTVAPMFHSWGFLMGCMCPVYSAAHCIISGGFDPARVLADMDRYQVTVFGGGPAVIYSRMLQAENFDQVNLTALRVCPSGGSPLPETVAAQWLEKTGLHIYAGYGMTEISPIACNRPGVEIRSGSVGKAAVFVELAVASLDNGARLPPGESGEFLVRAPHALNAYRNAPEETASTIIDGWIHTGDIGCLDADGYLYLFDRKKDLIIVNGFKVYPQEIDSALCRHGEVAAAATIGVVDARKGEAPVSFVVSRSRGWSDGKDIMDFLRTVLARYKMPREIIFADQLPITAANKIDRAALHRQYQSVAAACQQPPAPAPAGE